MSRITVLLSTVMYINREGLPLNCISILSLLPSELSTLEKSLEFLNYECLCTEMTEQDEISIKLKIIKEDLPFPLPYHTIPDENLYDNILCTEIYRKNKGKRENLNCLWKIKDLSPLNARYELVLQELEERLNIN